MIIIVFGRCQQRLDISIHCGVEVNPRLDRGALESSKYAPTMPPWDQGNHIISSDGPQNGVETNLRS